MSRWIKLLLMWSLALALPVQGLAAARMLHCAAGVGSSGESASGSAFAGAFAGASASTSATEVATPFATLFALAPPPAVDAPMSASHHAVGGDPAASHEGHAEAVAASADQTANDSGAHHAAAGVTKTCSACAACCAPALPMVSRLQAEVPASAGTVFDLRAPLLTLLATDAPDRPPRRTLP